MGGLCREGMTAAARPITSKQRGVRMPTKAQIEEFFASMEGGVGIGVHHFNDKYNYDFVRDEPMEEGRYEWVSLKSEVESKRRTMT